MKQKVSILLTVIILACLLTACGEVKEAEAAIDAIGTVSIDSLSAIEHAEALYAALDSKQKKVENAEVLISAREQYDKLVHLIADAESSLNSISVITPASGPDLEAAQNAYHNLEAAGLTDHVEGMLDTLRNQQAEYERQWSLIAAYENAVAAIENVTLDSIGAIEAAEAAYNVLATENLNGYVSGDPVVLAKAQYEELYLQSRYEHIVALYNSGNYSDTISAVWDLYDARPEHKYAYDAFVLAARSNIALAQIAFDQGDLESSLHYLDAAETSGSQLAEYTTLMQQVRTQLDAIRPENGKILYKKLGSGYSSLTIKAGETDACIKLESEDNPQKYIQFYVRANSEHTISVPNGTYLFKYTCGSNWFGETKMFGSSATYSQADEILDFTLSYSGNYVYYHRRTITLYTVIGGNFSTNPIDADSF